MTAEARTRLVERLRSNADWQALQAAQLGDEAVSAMRSKQSLSKVKWMARRAARQAMKAEAARAGADALASLSSPPQEKPVDYCKECGGSRRTCDCRHDGTAVEVCPCGYAGVMTDEKFIPRDKVPDELRRLRDRVRELEAAASPPPEGWQLDEDEDGVFSFDLDRDNSHTVSLSLTASELGWSFLWDGKVHFGRVKFTKVIAPELLAVLRVCLPSPPAPSGSGAR